MKCAQTAMKFIANEIKQKRIRGRLAAQGLRVGSAYGGKTPYSRAGGPRAGRGDAVRHAMCAAGVGISA